MAEKSNLANDTQAVDKPGGDESPFYLPRHGERGLIVGQTGCGKTTLARWLIERLPNTPVVLYDTKEEPKFEALPNTAIAYDWANVINLANDEQIDHIVFRPSIDELADPELLDGYLRKHYNELRGVDAYIDELYSFHNNGRAGPGLIALYTRGRSRGITTLASTQRPAWVSRFSMSEAQLFYIFHLNQKDDRKRVCDASGMPEYNNPPRHSFYIFRAGEDEARLIQPIGVDLPVTEAYTDVQPVSDEAPKATDEIRHVWL